MSKKQSFHDQHIVLPGTKIRLDKIPTKGRDSSDSRPQAEKEFKKLRHEFIELQYRLYAENRRSLMIVLQAMDAGGKDGTIRHVFRGVNPQGVVVTPLKVPTKEEAAHDFLWRVHKVAPAAGMIGVLNRSHYEEVLVVRVENLVPPEVWKGRYEHIRNFEKLLADRGTRILKFYLHISHKEQKKRFHERLTQPEKNWKFSPDDIAKSKHWNEYMAAFDDAIEQCSTKVAPWYVIPADQKWYRNLAVAGIIVETLREMNPQFPEHKDGVHDEDID